MLALFLLGKYSVKRLIPALLGACMLFSAAASAAPAAPAAPATALPAGAAGQFQQIYSAEWQWRQEQKRDAGLPRVDAATQETRRAYWERVLAQLDALDSASLTGEDGVNFAVYRAQVAALLAAQQFREYERPLNADTAFWNDLAYAARKPLRTSADYRAYLAQLNDVPRYFSEQMENMRAGLRRGFTPPRVTLTSWPAPYAFGTAVSVLLSVSRRVATVAGAPPPCVAVRQYSITCFGCALMLPVPAVPRVVTFRWVFCTVPVTAASTVRVAVAAVGFVPAVVPSPPRERCS